MQPAVFAKNHATHLAAAADVAAANPDQWVTFRSSRRWASASRLLEELGPGVVPVLFAVVDGGPEVWYRAWLQEVVLGPTEDSERTRLLLDLRPPTTQHEDLLEENPKTLFAISGCTRLNQAVPYATLIKRDGEPLSDTFGYSYALVQVADGEAGTAVVAATDIAAPPPRHNAVVSRVIRDTRLNAV